jgi:hypothetical protein
MEADLKKQDEGRDRIHLAQDRDQRKAVDKKVTNLWVL